MAVALNRRQFTVAEYYRMGEAGILGEDDRVELIEGEIVEMPPIGSRHASCVKRTHQLFARAIGDAAIVSVQDPLRLGDLSEPVPDVMLLRPRADFYAAGHPAAYDVLLLIEVSDTTLTYDQSVKAPLYARHGVSEVWIVDLDRAIVTVHRDPAPNGYRVTETRRRGDRLAPSAFPDSHCAVDDLLG
ncbi:MAG: Uma2 family endonuclease [Chloroflexi bacterium]|nr:Uma2 family endonuclease [Chloroflexota bacterium]